MHKVLKVAFVSVFLGNASLHAQSVRMSYLEFVEAAEKSGAQLGEQEAKLEFAKARSEFANSKAWFGGNLTALAAPVPGATGNAISGQTNWDNWGLLSSVQLEVFQPVYSFGAISSGQEAAESGVRAEAALLERDKLKLRVDIAELYYGYQMAFEFEQLTAEADDQLTKALTKIRSASQKDQLVSVANEIKIRRKEAELGKQNAKRAMAWKIGKWELDPQWDRANLLPRKVELASYEAYLKLLEEQRPERKALMEAVKAKKALYESQKSQYYPVVVVGAKGEFANAPHRENQQSPFANDPDNKLEGAVGLGIRWNLGVMERSSEVAKARAEWMEAEARLRHLDVGMKVELFKAYNDLQHAKATVELRQESTRAAKRLIQDFAFDQAMSKNQKWDQSVLQKFASYLGAKRDEIDSIYKFNVASHKFEQTVGKTLF